MFLAVFRFHSAFPVGRCVDTIERLQHTEHPLGCIEQKGSVVFLLQVCLLILHGILLLQCCIERQVNFLVGLVFRILQQVIHEGDRFGHFLSTFDVGLGIGNLFLLPEGRAQRNDAEDSNTETPAHRDGISP